MAAVYCTARPHQEYVWKIIRLDYWHFVGIKVNNATVRRDRRPAELPGPLDGASVCKWRQAGRNDLSKIYDASSAVTSAAVNYMI